MQIKVSGSLPCSPAPQRHGRRQQARRQIGSAGGETGNFSQANMGILATPSWEILSCAHPTTGPPSPLAAEPAVTEARTGILTACFPREKARGAGRLVLHPPKPDERRGSDSRASQLCFLVRGEHAGPGGTRPLPASTATRVVNTGQLQQGDVMHRTWTRSASSALASGSGQAHRLRMRETTESSRGKTKRGIS